MPRDVATAGACPKCGAAGLACGYNHFEKGELTIDSWEHRCPNCGHRETMAFRSDQPAAEQAADPGVCPYCGRRGQR